MLDQREKCCMRFSCPQLYTRLDVSRIGGHCPIATLPPKQLLMDLNKLDLDGSCALLRRCPANLQFVFDRRLAVFVLGSDSIKNILISHATSYQNVSSFSHKFYCFLHNLLTPLLNTAPVDPGGTATFGPHSRAFRKPAEV